MRTGALFLIWLLAACASRAPVETPDPSKNASHIDRENRGEPHPERASGDLDGGVQASDGGNFDAGAGANEAVDAGPWLTLPNPTPALLERLARESAPLRSFDFSSPDGRYSGKVLASAAPHLDAAKEGGVPILRIPIGAAFAINCALHEGRIHPAARLQLLLHNLEKKRTVLASGAVELRAVHGAPLLFVDVLHELPAKDSGEAPPAELPKGEPGLPDAGSEAESNAPPISPKPPRAPSELKIASFARGSTSLLCTHDGAGYRESFEQVVQSLAETAVDSQARKLAEPLQARLSAIRSEGKLIGYRLVRTLPPRLDGTREELSETPRFDRLENGNLLATELESVEIRGADGQLRHATFALGRAGSWSHVVLEEEPDGSYDVHGTAGEAKGDSLSGTVKGAKGLRRPSREELLAVASGARAELVFDDYSPLAPLELKLLRVHPGAAAGTLTVSDAGGEARRWTLDPAGEIVSSQERGLNGALELTEQIWALEGAKP